MVLTHRKISSGPLKTNCYILYDDSKENSADCWIIDAPPHSEEKIAQTLEEIDRQPASLLLTHSHWDHIADAGALKAHFGVEIWMHADDSENLIQPGSDGITWAPALLGAQPDRFLRDGEEIFLGRLKFTVIHTPGHSPGGICFYLAESDQLYCGDTLFRAGYGTLSLPTAEPDRMMSSLKRLFQLPPKTRVYPGHGDSTSIGEERKRYPQLSR